MSGSVALRLASGAIMVAALAALPACASLEGYQKNPDTAAASAARQQLYYGETADARYYAAPPSERKAIRDELVYGKMQVLEDDFLAFERSLNSAGNTVSVGSDLTVLLLNGFAATTGGAATKSALATASAGVIGAEGAINKDLYFQRTLPALISQMQDNRERARLRVVQNLLQSDAAYPLPAAELDLRALQEAGSLVSAVNTISEQSSTDKTGADQQIQQLRTVDFATTDSTKALKAWLYSNGAVDPTHMALLQAWLDRQPEVFLKGQGYPPAMFVSGDSKDATLEPIRQRALTDPTLAIPH